MENFVFPKKKKQNKKKTKQTNNLLRCLYGSRLLNSTLQWKRLYQSVTFWRNGVVKAYIIV